MTMIRLNFDRTIDKIAGNEYGQEVFENQIKDLINYNEKNVIIFPDTVDYVAISFIKGLIKEILENIPKSEFGNIVEFQAKNADVLAKILKRLRY